MGKRTYNIKNSIMKAADFEHILKQVKPLAKEIYLHVMGEPLLNPYLEEILGLCELYDIKANITTNGTLLYKKSDILLGSKALRTVNISLHSIEGREEEFDKYIFDVFSFAERAGEQDMFTCKLRIWNLNSDYENSYHSKRLIEEIENRFGLAFKVTDSMKSINGIRLRRRIFLCQADRFEWPDLNGDIKNGRAFCLGLRNQFAVLCDGSVVPCCLDGEGKINLGNIFQKPLSDILNSERAIKIYNGFTNGRAVEELCRRCGYRSRFKGE